MDGLAAEGFFEIGEAGPRMAFRGAVWSDAPKIKILKTFVFGVKNGGGE